MADVGFAVGGVVNNGDERGIDRDSRARTTAGPAPLRERARGHGACLPPYSGSGWRGLLATDGSVVDGCNVENASYPASLCAERAAVWAAVARGLRSFQALALSTEAETPTPPCGICRQVLMEFSPDLAVLSVTRGGAEARWTLSDLLPDAFTPTSLGRR